MVVNVQNLSLMHILSYQKLYIAFIVFFSFWYLYPRYFDLDELFMEV